MKLFFIIFHIRCVSDVCNPTFLVPLPESDVFRGFFSLFAPFRTPVFGVFRNFWRNRAARGVGLGMAAEGLAAQLAPPRKRAR